jgi:hypothetical protein
MDENLFTSICEALGYGARDVLSIRINPREAVVTSFRDGELQTVTHRVPGSDSAAKGPAAKGPAAKGPAASRRAGLTLAER